MELRQEVARGLRRRQIVTQEQHQRLVLAKLIEILRSFTARSPHCQQAFHHLRGAQTSLAAFQPDLPLDYRRCPSLTKRLDQSGNPRMPGDQPGFKLDINLKIQSVRHSPLPHPAGETYHLDRTKAESMTSRQNGPNPKPLAGD